MATELEIRAEQARQLLDNPVFKEGFYPLQVSIIDEIASTDPADEKRLAMLALKLQVMEEFRLQLTEAIESQLLEGKPQSYESPILQ